MMKDQTRPEDKGQSSGAAILLMFGGLAIVLGAFLLSQATAGVGALVIACFLGICARIAQAGQQHRVLVRLLRHEASARS
jgi:hypothetical protein